MDKVCNAIFIKLYQSAVSYLEEYLVASLVEELLHQVVLLQAPPLKRWIKSAQVEGVCSIVPQGPKTSNME